MDLKNNLLKLDVIFSFRNEELCLPELLARLRNIQNIYSEISFKFIFVDDASDDGSINILKKELKNGSIKIIRLSRRFGHSQGVYAGLKASQGDAVVYLDADLQDPPELIPEMIKRYKSGYDVVHMKRTNRLGESRIKMFMTNVAYKFIKNISYLDLQTNVGDFKLLSSRARDAILNLNENDPYLRGLSVWIGYNQTTISYVREKRYKGKTHFSIFSSGPTLEFLRGLTSFSNFLLIYSIFTASIAILFSVAYIFATVLFGNVMASDDFLFDKIYFSTLFIVLFSILMIIGIYISKIFNSTHSRPKYLVSEELSSDE